MTDQEKAARLRKLIEALIENDMCSNIKNFALSISKKGSCISVMMNGQRPITKATELMIKHVYPCVNLDYLREGTEPILLYKKANGCSSPKTPRPPVSTCCHEENNPLIQQLIDRIDELTKEVNYLKEDIKNVEARQSLIIENMQLVSSIESANKMLSGMIKVFNTHLSKENSEY